MISGVAPAQIVEIPRDTELSKRVRILLFLSNTIRNLGKQDG
jgi:hypothetical protein